jgi:hypothetical protein
MQQASYAGDRSIRTLQLCGDVRIADGMRHLDRPPAHNV